MSGGSFDYLYIKDADELMGNTENLTKMIGSLAHYAPNSKALDRAIQLQKTIEDARKTINDEIVQLSDVFKAVEWYVSGDFNIDAVNEAVAEFEDQANEPT